MKQNIYCTATTTDDDDEVFTPEEEQSIARGLQDIKTGDVLTLEEMKKELGL